MKVSLRRQMTVVFIGLLVFILGAVFVVNTGFLAQYYVSHKVQDLLDAYASVGTVLEQGSLSEQSSEILYEAEKANIDLAIVNSNAETLLSTAKDGSQLFIQLFMNLYGRNETPSTILEQTDDYILCRAANPDNNMEYLEMWGEFSDGSFFMMRSPLESIRESAALANQFLIYLGLTGIILGGILVWLFARRITRPIMELAKLSEKMANLDFDEKYTSGGSNEIGILGENFNKMSRQLEQTISELKTANNQLQQDIEQKEKIENMRNEFLGNVSHELKTPLALIQGYAEGLKEGVNDDPESREFYCDVIMDEAGKMNRMVKNLLTLNQLEFGSDEVEFERFDVIGLVKGVISSCEILIQQAEATVSFIGDETVYVWADEFKTEQVVRNYLTNAIHHVENERRIEVRVIRQEDKVRVTVFNSGKPIPEEDVPKLWDKFYKVDKAHTREYGGNGIGLSIVKAIMESFHQKYGVNNFDNGVEFWFELDAGNSRKKEESTLTQ
ncbi:HAMP domain-containing protein [Mediterraneibacter glycyrrhizinilyticus]|nr:HAMP domain-containing sensor histidine kinase [Mediterraneibacter glycyrrhizinilyticus]MBM6852827.1 HAMP domain-containing protein [Mediterraneibacter glycyrrhizinilyticus]